MKHNGGGVYIQPLPQSILTCRLVEGVSSQSERDAALMAREAAPMEELALGADALQRVDPLTAEVALLAVRHRRGGFRLRGGRGRGTELGGRRRPHRLREKDQSGKCVQDSQLKRL